MNYDLLSLLVFYLVILFIIMRNKDKFEIQGKFVALYRTKFGLKMMDWLPSLAPKIFRVLGFIGMTVGFLGMVFIFIFLIKETLSFVVTPGAVPPLAPVLPGVTIPGAPKLSFWHWIISIFLVALVHEFSHGIFARLYRIPVKSSGFAIFGPILGAFVEPDEKKLQKAKLYKKLAVFAAGPFSNFVFGIIFLLLFMFVTAPMQSGLFEQGGITVMSVNPDYPMNVSAGEVPYMILSVNGKVTNNVSTFLNATTGIQPGDIMRIRTDKNEYSIVAAPSPQNKSIGYLGLTELKVKSEVKEKFLSFGKLPYALVWLNLLIFWLFLINVGVGMFNLLPLGPTDGGRMFYSVCLGIFKTEKRAKRVWGIISMVCLALIIINLLPWLWKFLVFIGKGVMLVLA